MSAVTLLLLMQGEGLSDWERVPGSSALGHAPRPVVVAMSVAPSFASTTLVVQPKPGSTSMTPYGSRPSSTLRRVGA